MVFPFDYHKERQTLKQIAEDIGCSQYFVRKSFINYNLKTRKPSRRVKVKSRGSYKYPQLNDKDWLYKKYIIEHFSTVKIAKIVGVKTENSVRQALIRNGIEVRSVSDGLTINREDDGFIFDIPVIEGGLLGDASMGAWNKESDKSYPCFYRKNKNYDHVKYVAEILFDSGGIDKITENKSVTNGKKHTAFKISSQVKKELMPLYRKWYPPENNYIKVLPEDTDISPTSLLHWFLDDGCSTRRKGYGRKSRQILIVFCSESFTREEQEFLCGRIMDEHGLKTNVRPANSGTGWRIYIPQSNADLFYEIIGKCPVPSLEYKWK